MPNIGFAAIFQLQTAVFLNSIFQSCPYPGAHGHHGLGSFLDHLNGLFVHIRADDAMAVAGIDHHPFRGDAQILRKAGAYLGQVVVADGADFTNGHSIYCHDNCHGVSLLQN